MKIWATEHIFNHSWETVTQAVWRKYPNPHKPEVVSTDVVERNINNGVLHTKRLIGTRWGLPDWAKKIIGTEKICYAYEHSEVNPRIQSMVMRTHNLTLSNLVSLDEKMEYVPDPNNKANTLLRQETYIAVQGVPLGSYIENYLLNSITNNSFKGQEAMEWIISKIEKEVEDLMTSYKRSRSELMHSIGGIKHTAKKSIGDISSATIKGLDEIQTLGQHNGSLPSV